MRWPVATINTSRIPTQNYDTLVRKLVIIKVKAKSVGPLSTTNVYYFLDSRDKREKKIIPE